VEIQTVNGRYMVGWEYESLRKMLNPKVQRAGAEIVVEISKPTCMLAKYNKVLPDMKDEWSLVHSLGFEKPNLD
jgi:hypothetical protein